EVDEFAPTPAINVATMTRIRARMPLPPEFHGELNLALARLRRRRQLPGIWNHVAASVEDLHFRRLQVRRVEQIERFDAELQSRPVVRQRPVLDQGRLELVKPRAPQRVPPQLPALAPRCT